MNTMLTITRGSATLTDFEFLPEGTPCQLIDGELIVSPAPNFRHQSIIFEFAGQLRNFLRRTKLGRAVCSPIDVILDDSNAYQPDVVFISNARLSIITKGRIYGAPDLVMEVLSPRTAEHDLNEKKATYERSGVLEYWVVDPAEETIDIFANRDSGFALIFSARATGEARSEILPGFSVALQELFEA